MPLTVAHQVPLSIGFPKQEYQSGLLFPSPGDLLDLRIKPTSPALTDAFFAPEPQVKPHHTHLSATCWFFQERTGGSVVSAVLVRDLQASECNWGCFHQVKNRFYLIALFFESMKTLFQSSKFYLKVF